MGILSLTRATGMDPLLSTKTAVPQARHEIVHRPRLLALLDEGLRGPLTLVSAPAGFGKTTLVATWAAGSGVPAAWVSLDGTDSDPTRFVSYVVMALRRAGVEIRTAGDWQPDGTATAGRSNPQAEVAQVVNGVQAFGADCLLILDDYHLLSGAEVHGLTRFLLEHAPANLHLVLVSRADPPLPLALLRGRGHLAELRSADLRFSQGEALTFLSEIMGVELSSADVTRLNRRTEGWVAGLQMAAVSMRGRGDVSAFIKAFAGSHRYIMDYLLEEVWSRQTPEVQAFLLSTSILTSMCASLCDALGEADSQSVLEMLDRQNLFIEPLDERRLWFRYHRLFRDLLQQRLTRLQPGDASALHDAASRWYEEHQRPAEAIEHALAAGGDDRAAALILEAAEATLARSELTTFLSWVAALPDDYLSRWPGLAVYVAWSSLWGGTSPRAIHAILDDLEAAPDVAAGRAAALRATTALYCGDIDAMAEHTARARRELAADDVLFRGMLNFLEVLQGVDAGGSAEDAPHLRKVARRNAERGNLLAATMTLVSLAEIYMRQGRLSEAEPVYEEALAMAQTDRGEPIPVAGQAIIGLGTIAYLRDDLERAWPLAKEGTALAKLAGEAFALDGVLLLARLNRATGDDRAASELLEQARMFAVAFDATDLDDEMVAIELANHSVISGDLAGARRWAENAGLLPVAPAAWKTSVDGGPFSRLRKYQMATVARLLLAEGDATAALEAASWAADCLERRGRVVYQAEALALASIALERLGRRAQAVDTLDRALWLAEPCGYVRGFVEMGQELVPLLGAVLGRRGAGAAGLPLASRVLAALSGQDAGATPSHRGPPVERGPLLDPLTDRERAVLGLLPTHLSSSEIAQRLVVAPSTVRSHIKRIYSKLGAHSRDQAVQIARDQGLL